MGSGNFVYDGTSLPSGKADSRPLSGPANYSITAAEWNTVMQSIADLRSAIRTTGVQTLNVATTGVDTNAGTGGAPLFTIAKAIAETPRILYHPFIVSLGAGTFDGFQVRGLMGGGRVSGIKAGLYVNGNLAQITPATGVATGTAGAGSNSTTLVKPTAAANWTANDLRGKLLQVTGGGGYSGDANHPVLRPILANTTTTATVHAIPGMDSTTTFKIVLPNSIIAADPAQALGSAETYGVLISDCEAPVTLRGLKFSGALLNYLVCSQSSADVTLDGCVIDVDTVTNSILSRGDRKFTLKNCVISSGADVKASDSEGTVTVAACWENNGRVRIERGHFANVQIEALSCTGNALAAVGLNYLQAEVNANSCTATPVYLEAIHYFEATGSKLTGTNGGAPYGLEIQKEGRYLLAGCSIAGASNLLVDGSPETWANISSPSYGVVMKYGATLVADAGQTKAIVEGNYQHTGDIYVGGRLYAQGYLNVSSNLAGITATGTTAADAYDMEANGVRCFADVTTTPANSGIKLPNGASIGGCLVIIYNRGANALKIYPSTGGTVDGGASINLAAGAKKILVSLNDAGGKSFVSVT